MGRAVHHGPRKVTSSETWLVKFNRLKGFEVPLLHFFFFLRGEWAWIRHLLLGVWNGYIFSTYGYITWVVLWASHLEFRIDELRRHLMFDESMVIVSC